jgi:DDE superfamily endonuclease
MTTSFFFKKIPKNATSFWRQHNPDSALLHPFENGTLTHRLAIAGAATQITIAAPPFPCSSLEITSTATQTTRAATTITDDMDTENDVILMLHSVIHPDKLMTIGLTVFYNLNRLLRSRCATNVKRFIKKFGAHPIVCLQIWEDLQTTHHEDARVDKEKLNPRFFLMALHHLKKYPTEDDRESEWDVSPKTSREWIWFYLEKIQALKKQKIVWPDDWGASIWVLTVDGTHCWINEPKHPDWSQDRQYYSHKFAKAGINYELAIAIATQRLVWMAGPYKAGTNDVTIFKSGLKLKLAECGKKAIGDRGYTGHHEQVSTYNAHDSRNVKKFKSRALKRHETFNFMTKRFKCLDGRFRHGVDRFATCFEAVCVICQYQIEHDMPLYDVLIEDIM